MTAKRSNEFDQVIAKRIRARRLQMSMSQEELGDRLGLTFQQVQKYEKGTNRVSAGRLVEIAKILKTTPDWFLKDLVDGPVSNEQDRGLSFLQTREGLALTSAMVRAKPAQRTAVLKFLNDIL